MKHCFRLIYRLIFIILLSMFSGGCGNNEETSGISSPFGPKELEKIIITFDHKIETDIEIPEGIKGSASSEMDPSITDFETPVRPEGNVFSLRICEMPIELRDTELKNGILSTKNYGDIEVYMLGLRQGESIFELRATHNQIISLEKEIIKYEDNRRDLFSAVLDDDIPKLKSLIDAEVDLNVRSVDDVTPLIAAIIMNNDQAAQILLDANADVDARDYKGWTALIHSASANSSIEMVDALIRANADINASGRHGTTALIMASVKGNMDVVKALVKKGADLDAAAEIEGEKFTALRAAERGKHVEIAEFLKNSGAK